MSIPESVSQVIKKHVTLEVECIDRMYLNVIVPNLQWDKGVVSFFRYHRGKTFASSALMQPISKRFIAGIEDFVGKNNVPMIKFTKGQRKDDVAQEYLRKFHRKEGVFLVGKVQEKTPVFRTERRRHPETGIPYPWIVKTTAMINQYYFYCLDENFGHFFLKFGSYFPYNAKICLNGHEYAKRQLAKERVPFKALDNGILSCQDPRRLQEICNRLSERKINALLRKWLARLPNPFTARDRRAGYRYRISILQAEFSLTQVLDRPATGRRFFEEVIRENLDLGRPDQVQLIFNRRVTKKTPGRFRTRVITNGVIPSLHVDYKNTRIKQYHKEGRALRTETTINNARDFRIGRLLHNLPALREVGFQANRRLLDVQKASHESSIGEDAFDRVTQPVQVHGQRASALRFGDPMVQNLFQVLVLFHLLPAGFSNRDLRERLAQLLGSDPAQFTQGKMTYQLRRLRLHGIIQRIPKTHRYRLTPHGLRTAIFFTRVHIRVFRPGLSRIMPEASIPDPELRPHFAKIDLWIDKKLKLAG